jgi:MoaA/NifB/PqqE/SkfB family radical SAM enzyme
MHSFYQDTSGRKITMLHLEPTDVCQAKCPQCARETDCEFDPKSQNHLTVEQLLKVLTPEDFKNLDKVLLCGNYGDPAAGKYTLEIIKFVKNINNSITVGLHSNGGLQNAAWWSQLGSLLTLATDYVVFSIDGLEDLNSVYRVNVNWQILMSNIGAYVAAGGSAHWDMLVFQHNQHQVEDCENLARKLGFTIFRAKVSKRPMTSTLALPVGWANPNIDSTVIIDCHALKEKSLYIDAQGRVSPCCWLGSTQTKFITNFDDIRASWNSDQVNPVCRTTCGQSNHGSSFTRQWQKQAIFK